MPPGRLPTRLRTQRATIDYALARRSTLAGLLTGRTSTLDVCDAHPYLLRAAQHYGEPTGERCPVCRRAELLHVHYAYGEELKDSAGQAHPRAALARLAEERREVQVYVVEVCRDCSWNHLVSSFVIGSGASTGSAPVAGKTRGAAGAGRSGGAGRPRSD